MTETKPGAPRLLGVAKKNKTIRVWRLASGAVRYERTRTERTERTEEAGAKK